MLGTMEGYSAHGEYNQYSAANLNGLTKAELVRAGVANREIVAGTLTTYPLRTDSAAEYFTEYLSISPTNTFGCCGPSAFIAAWDSCSPETIPEEFLPPSYYRTLFNKTIMFPDIHRLTGSGVFIRYYGSELGLFEVSKRCAIRTEDGLESIFDSLGPREALAVYLSLHFPLHKEDDTSDGDRDTHLMFCTPVPEDLSKVYLVGDTLPLGDVDDDPDYLRPDRFNNALIVEKSKLCEALNDTLDLEATTPYGNILMLRNANRGNKAGVISANCIIIRFK